MVTRESYASLNRRGRPNALLVDAIGQVRERCGYALDVGAGPLNDTDFLLRAGFSVHAVDRDPHAVAIALAIGHPRLNMVQADIRDIPIAKGTYALVAAIHVLPFLPRADLPAVMSALIEGLSSGGILCCTFLGPGDAWADRRPQMTFLSRAEITPLLSALAPITFTERRYDGKNASGEPKQWHVFRCIFRKEDPEQPHSPSASH
jgi:tellurite methyltransferase